MPSDPGERSGTSTSSDPTPEEAWSNHMYAIDAAGSSALGPWRVRRIGYGAMQLAGDNVFGPPRDRDEALRVRRAAVDNGVTHIDTAQYYGPGVVNELIREALHPYPADLAIVSKVDEVNHRIPAMSVTCSGVTLTPDTTVRRDRRASGSFPLRSVNMYRIVA